MACSGRNQLTPRFNGKILTHQHPVSIPAEAVRHSAEGETADLPLARSYGRRASFKQVPSDEATNVRRRTIHASRFCAGARSKSSQKSASR
jgi:hypothetical protein